MEETVVMRWLGILVLVLLLLIPALIYILPRPYTIISVSQIYIDPEGGRIDENNKLRGCYWVIVASIDQADRYEGRVTLPNRTKGTFKDYEAYTAKKLEIVIQPAV